MNDYLKCHHCQQPLVKEESAFCGTYYAHVSCKLQHDNAVLRGIDAVHEMTRIAQETGQYDYNYDAGGD